MLWVFYNIVDSFDGGLVARAIPLGIWQIILSEVINSIIKLLDMLAFYERNNCQG